MSALSWQERFANCHESFRAEITALAQCHGKTVEQVYGWWREYSETCRNYDQSAILGEFKEWYKDRLEIREGAR